MYIYVNNKEFPRSEFFLSSYPNIANVSTIIKFDFTSTKWVHIPKKQFHRVSALPIFPKLLAKNTKLILRNDSSNIECIKRTVEHLNK